MSKIDLHLHTNLSDGLLSPENVIILAKENGCQTIAITDHELCENYELLSQKYDINIISGIEFNTSISNLHLLGYGIIDFDKMKYDSIGWTAIKQSSGTNGILENNSSSYDGQYSTEEVGNGNAHNNMPPYLAVNMWKRIA